MSSLPAVLAPDADTVSPAARRDKGSATRASLVSQLRGWCKMVTAAQTVKIHVQNVRRDMMAPTNRRPKLMPVLGGAAIERRRAKITTEIAALGLPLPGSLVKRRTRCGNTGCRCHGNPPQLHGPYMT